MNIANCMTHLRRGIIFILIIMSCFLLYISTPTQSYALGWDINESFYSSYVSQAGDYALSKDEWQKETKRLSDLSNTYGAEKRSWHDRAQEITSSEYTAMNVSEFESFLIELISIQNRINIINIERELLETDVIGSINSWSINDGQAFFADKDPNNRTAAYDEALVGLGGSGCFVNEIEATSAHENTPLKERFLSYLVNENPKALASYVAKYPEFDAAAQSKYKTEQMLSGENVPSESTNEVITTTVPMNMIAFSFVGGISIGALVMSVIAFVLIRKQNKRIARLEGTTRSIVSHLKKKKK